MNNIFNKNLYHFRSSDMLIIYSILYLSLIWLYNSIIFTNSYYYSTLGKQLTEERISEAIEINKRFRLLNFFLIPLIYIIKCSILSGIIYIGLILFNQDISYKDCFKIVQLAELAMILAATAKLTWFIFNKPQTIEDLQYFYPLALTQLFVPNQIPKYLIYPLQQLNVFEVLYWLLIAGGIKAFTQKTFAQSLKITALSYGVTMFVWCLVIVFIQLQFS